MPQRTNPKPKPKPLSNPRSTALDKATTKQPLPKNWPSNLTYLTRPIYSPHLTPTELSSLQSLTPPSPNPSSSPSPQATATATTTNPPQTPSPLVRIHRVTKPPTHPALHQNGLFTTRALAPRTHVLDYVGYVHSSLASDTDPTSDHGLSLDRELGIGIDAGVMGNEGRFVNGYSGVRGEGPNAEFREWWVRGDGGGRWERRVGVWVLGGRSDGRGRRGIRRGEEVCVSYGKGFWRERERKEDVLGDDRIDEQALTRAQIDM